MPTRITSPGVSRCGFASFVPFTYVPFVEPASETQTPSRLGSSRAWRADAKSSSSGMSFSALRPTRSVRESSPRFRPSGKTRRPV